MQVERTYNVRMESKGSKDSEAAKTKINVKSMKDSHTRAMSKILWQIDRIGLFHQNLPKFNYCKTIFEKIMDSRVANPRSRFTQVIKYTKGKNK